MMQKPVEWNSGICLKVPRMMPGGVDVASEIPALFRRSDVEYHNLGCVNWPESFPDKPSVQFALAHDCDSLMLHCMVTENSVKGDFSQDFSKVWEDSCFELFLSPDSDCPLSENADAGSNHSGYYNIECNCLGALYFCYGPGRADRLQAPAAALAQISRWTSLGVVPFGILSGIRSWEIALKIPVSSFFAGNILLPGAKMRCNIYKCGNTLHPHYLSYFPINTVSPDFHRPDFFGNLLFF